VTAENFWVLSGAELKPDVRGRRLQPAVLDVYPSKRDAIEVFAADPVLPYAFNGAVTDAGVVGGGFCINAETILSLDHKLTKQALGPVKANPVASSLGIRLIFRDVEHALDVRQARALHSVVPAAGEQPRPRQVHICGDPLHAVPPSLDSSVGRVEKIVGVPANGKIGGKVARQLVHFAVNVRRQHTLGLDRQTSVRRVLDDAVGDD